MATLAPTPTAPNASLYVKNIAKVKPDELKAQLYALFNTYGTVRAITRPGRGQAFIVFTDRNASAAALKSLQGFVFYGRPLHLEYAQTQSAATITATLGPEALFDPAVQATMRPRPPGTEEEGARKRPRSPERAPDKPAQTAPDNADEEEAEMQMDDESDAERPAEPRTLRATDLPAELTTEMLEALFSEHGAGRVSLDSVTHIATIEFPTSQRASQARSAMNGFRLTPEAQLHLQLVDEQP